MEMREGSLWKKIFLYSVPLMFTNLLQVFFNLADVAVAGKFAGPTALGAVGSTTILITLTTGLLIGMSNGINALAALYMGADDVENEGRCVHTGFLLCLCAGILVMSAGLFFSGPMLRILGTKKELMDQALIYFRIYMFGSAGLAVYNFGNALLSAAGDTKRPLKYLTIAGILNVILNLVFVIALKMGAAGVALASIISQCLSAVLILRALLTADAAYRLDMSLVRLDMEMAAKILKISIPTAVQYSLFAVANLAVQSAVNTFDHVTVEGNSAAMNADAIVYDMMAAFYTACTSFIAQNFGAGKKERVKQTYFITTAYSFGLGLVLGLCLFVFRRQFLCLFTDDSGVISRGLVRVGIMSVSYCVSAFMDNATAASRGLGETLVPTVIVVMGSVVYRLIWIFTVFARFHTLESLYLLYVTAWICTALMGNVYFFRQYGKKCRGMQG